MLGRRHGALAVGDINLTVFPDCLMMTFSSEQYITDQATI